MSVGKTLGSQGASLKQAEWQSKINSTYSFSGDVDEVRCCKWRWWGENPYGSKWGQKKLSFEPSIYSQMWLSNSSHRAVGKGGEGLLLTSHQPCGGPVPVVKVGSQYFWVQMQVLENIPFYCCAVMISTAEWTVNKHPCAYRALPLQHSLTFLLKLLTKNQKKSY